MEGRYPVPLQSGERQDAEDLEGEIRTASESPALELLFEYPEFILLVNRSRQIVWANREALEALRAGSLGEVAGKRPGEALGCVHSRNQTGGCGTSRFCAFCGAARSLADSLAGSPGREECAIRRDDPPALDSLELLVWTRPLEIGGRDLILFSARDISAQKRREILERVFYHDILNTAASLQSLSSLIRGSSPSELSGYLEMAEGETERLVEEIASQRLIKEAEDGNLSLNVEDCGADSLLDEALRSFRHLFRLKGVILERRSAGTGLSIRTDRALARRVLVNILKNALEASGEKDRVLAAAEECPGGAEFRIRNPAVLSEEQKRRIFHRSYSTKGSGRGLGTYGMKLLGERYLGGRVGFESTEGEGTTFVLFLPSEIPE